MRFAAMAPRMARLRASGMAGTCGFRGSLGSGGGRTDFVDAGGSSAAASPSASFSKSAALASLSTASLSLPEYAAT